MTAKRTPGCKGMVYVKTSTASGAATRVFGVSNWGTAEAADESEASEIGDCAKTFIPGAVESTLSLDLWWDPLVPANQEPLRVSETIDFQVFPGGPTSGNTVYSSPSGGAVVLSRDLSGSNEGAVGGTFNIRVNGKLVSGLVP